MISATCLFLLLLLFTGAVRPGSFVFDVICWGFKHVQVRYVRLIDFV